MIYHDISIVITTNNTDPSDFMIFESQGRQRCRRHWRRRVDLQRCWLLVVSTGNIKRGFIGFTVGFTGPISGFKWTVSMHPHFSIYVWFQKKWISSKLFYNSREFLQQPREFIQLICSSGHLATLVTYLVKTRSKHVTKPCFPGLKNEFVIPLIFMSIYVPSLFGSASEVPPPEKMPRCATCCAKPRLFTATSGPNGHGDHWKNPEA